MSMGKKDFIRLADKIRCGNELEAGRFSDAAIHQLANFCEEQNPRFNRERWIDYIAGRCGPSGGRIEL